MTQSEPTAIDRLRLVQENRRDRGRGATWADAEQFAGEADRLRERLADLERTIADDRSLAAWRAAHEVLNAAGVEGEPDLVARIQALVVDRARLATDLSHAFETCGCTPTLDPTRLFLAGGNVERRWPSEHVDAIARLRLDAVPRTVTGAVLPRFAPTTRAPSPRVDEVVDWIHVLTGQRANRATVRGVLLCLLDDEFPEFADELHAEASRALAELDSYGSGHPDSCNCGNCEGAQILRAALAVPTTALAAARRRVAECVDEVARSARIIDANREHFMRFDSDGMKKRMLDVLHGKIEALEAADRAVEAEKQP